MYYRTVHNKRDLFFEYFLRHDVFNLPAIETMTNWLDE